jgi:hypothetical protein
MVNGFTGFMAHKSRDAAATSNAVRLSDYFLSFYRRSQFMEYKKKIFFDKVVVS